jgi:hypothetical protein
VLVLVESVVDDIMKLFAETVPPPIPTDSAVLVPPPTIRVPVVLDVDTIVPEINSVVPTFKFPSTPIPPRDTIDPVLVLVLKTVEFAWSTPPI